LYHAKFHFFNFLTSEFYLEITLLNVRYFTTQRTFFNDNIKININDESTQHTMLRSENVALTWLLTSFSVFFSSSARLWLEIRGVHLRASGLRSSRLDLPDRSLSMWSSTRGRFTITTTLQTEVCVRMWNYRASDSESETFSAKLTTAKIFINV